ncbi:FAD dependent oxidoreductase [Nemania serpens]|nr:FAD dependent oxidoreductase [Nemania serpens]
MVLVTLPPKAQARRAELPTPDSTHSYWHREPSKTLLDHRTTEDLPTTADVVVVGSGISAAFAARELVAGGRSVVMLEAREACWGATGRNGGHCQPTVWDSVEEVARFELATFDLIAGLVAEHDIPCDWHVVGGVHAIYSQEVLEAAEKQMIRLRKSPDLKDKAELIQDRAELAARRVPAALGAIFQPNAAKLWPYKLVAWVLETLLRDHDAAVFNLQTNTPVTRLERGHGPSSSSSSSVWVAHTPRGEVRAREVLLATNAYTSYLLPGLTDVIVPVRGQICALEPPPGAAQLAHSYVWTKDASDQYLIHRGLDDAQVPQAGSEGREIPRSRPRPGTGDEDGSGVGDRSLILGGERFAVPEGEEGVSRDDTINPLVSRALHRGLSHAVKLLPADERERDALRATYEWTGIMGYSRDGQPWVGRVPGAFLGASDNDAENTGISTSAVDVDGLWMTAAFTGHGMPVAPRCGIAVAQMILGKGGEGEKDGVRVPRAWIPSVERVAGARSMELPRTLEDMLRLLPPLD